MPRRPPDPADILSAIRGLAPARDRAPDADGLVRSRATVRLAVIGLLVGFSYLAVAGRASMLMLLPDPRLERKARVQFEQAVEVDGRRGDILDINGTLLATTVELLELHVDPSKFGAEAAADLAAVLAPVLGQDRADLFSRISRPGRRDVRLARGLTPAESDAARAAVRSLIEQRPGLRWATWTSSESRRFYPGRGEAAALVGLVGHGGAGVAGLERTMDDRLRGETYKYVLWRDRKGRRITPENIRAESGQSVVVTIDRGIQHAAEVALDDAMERTGAASALAVVVDVATGGLVAVANRPNQNPNDSAGIDLTQLKNHAAMDAIEPGSVFKPFIAAAALEEGIVTPTSLLDCEGGRYRVGRKTIRDDHPHDLITISEVIKFSSNIGATKLAFELGPHRALGYLSDFGFGRKTGLSLPGETRGLLRDPDTIKRIELATTSYGYGVNASAIQLAYAMATLGNGGVRMQPRLIEEVRDSHGDVIDRFDPRADRRVVSEEVARQVVGMMTTVTETGGTGTRARVPGYLVAGKTGTAWKYTSAGYSPNERVGSFVGLIPADAPRLAIAVVVDSPTIGSSYGGIVAAPAFAMIGTESMRLLSIAPDPALLDLPEVDDDVPAAVPLASTEVTWTDDGLLRIPDLSGLSLRDSLVVLQGAGLEVTTRGSGRVATQLPAAGTTVSMGERVEVVLQ